MTSTTSPATAAAVDLDAVRAAVEAVLDPELPVVTLAMLGMVHDVRAVADGVVAELLPTFAGCPATDMIAADVRDAVAAVADDVTVAVRFLHTPAWTSARITAAGREALASFGIAPPVPPGGRTSLPVLPSVAAPVAAPRPCPWCGSLATERDGLFGPTPCRDVRFCTDCQQPFEGFKS